MPDFPITTWPATSTPTARVYLEVICCPLCKSLSVRMEQHRAGRALSRWRCSSCRHSWRERAEVGGRRVAVP